MKRLGIILIGGAALAFFALKMFGKPTSETTQSAPSKLDKITGGVAKIVAVAGAAIKTITGGLAAITGGSAAVGGVTAAGGAGAAVAAGGTGTTVAASAGTAAATGSVGATPVAAAASPLAVAGLLASPFVLGPLLADALGMGKTMEEWQAQQIAAAKADAEATARGIEAMKAFANAEETKAALIAKASPGSTLIAINPISGGVIHG